MGTLIVQKYGGTSVGSPERIRSVADRIVRAKKQGHSLVVVVSAMGHATDELITLAHQVSDQPQPREMDMLLTAGERVSMALLSMALADRKTPALSFTGSQSGIITDTSHQRARIRRILGDRIRAALAQDRVAIVAGFQGVSEEKEITTLGRGGSDTTAVALAAVLGAERCELYTDVDGICSADPRLVPGAKLWPRIPADLMVEFALRGAGKPHPRAVELAKQYNVPLRILSSLSDQKGTLVTSREASTGMEEFGIVGVTAAKDKMLVTVELARTTVLGALWDRATHSHLPVLAPMFADGRVRFFTDCETEGEWRKQLQDLAVQGFVRSFEVDRGTLPLSVVGDRFAQDGSALSEVIDVLARNQILVTMGTASSLAITVGVPRQHADDGVKALHEVFLGIPGGSA